MKINIMIAMAICIPTTLVPMGKCNPGCIRQNSDELRKFLLFAHLEQGEFGLVKSLLDAESIYYTDNNGNTIRERLGKLDHKNNPAISGLLDQIKKIEAN